MSTNSSETTKIEGITNNRDTVSKFGVIFKNEPIAPIVTGLNITIEASERYFAKLALLSYLNESSGIVNTTRYSDNVPAKFVLKFPKFSKLLP